MGIRSPKTERRLCKTGVDHRRQYIQLFILLLFHPSDFSYSLISAIQKHNSSNIVQQLHSPSYTAACPILLAVIFQLISPHVLCRRLAVKQDVAIALERTVWTSIPLCISRVAAPICRTCLFRCSSVVNSLSIVSELSWTFKADQGSNVPHPEQDCQHRYQCSASPRKHFQLLVCPDAQSTCRNKPSG